MQRFFIRHGLTAAVVIMLAAMSPRAASADIGDFEFRLVQTDIKKSDGAIITVQLVDVRSGKTVSDAVIFATRIDMAPEGMPTMTAPIEALPPTAPGTYRFKTDLTMAGGWQLSLAAKVQGETGTLESQMILQAVP